MLHTAAPHVDVPTVPEAEKAASHCTPVMLDNTKGVLDVGDYVLGEVILDTGAAKVMLSKKFVEALGIDLSTLTPEPKFVIAGGNVETTMGQSAAKLEFILLRGTDHELRVTLTALVVNTNAYCALLGTKFITATNGPHDSYTETFKYRYPKIDGILHSYESPSPCHSVTHPLVAYAFSLGLILSYEDEEMLAPGRIDANQHICLQFVRQWRPSSCESSRHSKIAAAKKMP